MDDVIGLTLQLHEETKNKILVSESGYLNDTVWLQKPKIEFYPAADEMIEIRMPEALAEKHGLV